MKSDGVAARSPRGGRALGGTRRSCASRSACPLELHSYFWTRPRGPVTATVQIPFSLAMAGSLRGIAFTSRCYVRAKTVRGKSIGCVRHGQSDGISYSPIDESWTLSW